MPRANSKEGSIMAIADILGTGKQNAVTGATLADRLGCSTRELAAAIERERRAGAPICASQSRPMGFYLAADEYELAEYCQQVKSRAINLFKTRQALVKVLKDIEQRKEADTRQGVYSDYMQSIGKSTE